MSFHPEIPYGTGQHRSDRVLSPEGEPFAFTPAQRTRFEELASHYPPEQRKSTVLYGLFMVQEQIGYVSRNGMRHVAEVILQPRETIRESSETRRKVSPRSSER